MSISLAPRDSSSRAVASTPAAMAGVISCCGRPVTMPMVMPATPSRSPSRWSGTGSAALPGSAGVVPGDGVQHQGAVLGGPAQRAGHIERPAIGQHARAAGAAIGRLQPRKAVRRRRQAYRPAGVRAQREGRDPGRDRRTRAGRGPAGETVEVPRIARHREGQVVMDRAGAGAVFPGVQLAQQDRARGFQARDDGRRGVGGEVSISRDPPVVRMPAVK